LLPRVIATGETMLLGLTPRPGLLRHAHALELKIGGAESNVAIALSRLDVPSAWVGFLGDDEAGQLVLDRVRGEGVDTSRVSRVEGYPTGLYLRDSAGGKVRVHYYRAGSAASRMAPGAFDPDYLLGTDFLHLTGITPALSKGCAEFVRWAAREARARGVRVSFDVNYRSKLWAPEPARDFVERLLPDLDLLFVGDDEALALWGAGGEGLARRLAAADPSGGLEVVLKEGERGSAVLVEDRFFEEDGFGVPEVDPVGAGDAHVAGYLAGSLWGLGLGERLRLANAMGAYSVMTLGDYEGLPGAAEVRDLMEGKSKPGR
jgi:2-dehydro-3-deoxygluconokinase